MSAGAIRTRLLVLVVACSVCRFPFPARAIDRYVDCARSAPGDGSAPSPWPDIADAVAGAAGGDVVHVRNGPCDIGTIAFARPELSGPAREGDCVLDGDDFCTVFEGEPETVEIRPAAPDIDGFIVGGRIRNLKIAGFRFVGRALADGTTIYFNEPLKVVGPETSSIVLTDVHVVGAHGNGIGIFGAGEGEATHRIRVEDAAVEGVRGNGYVVRAHASEDPLPVVNPVFDVRFTRAVADSNGDDGFVVPYRTDGQSTVYDITFDRTVARANGGDGYDINADHLRHPGQTTRFLDVEAVGNRTGIKVGHSAVIENAWVEANRESGIAASAQPGDETLATLIVVGATLRDNAAEGGAGILVSRAVGGAAVAAHVYDTIVTSPDRIALSYVAANGSTFDWDYDVFHRSGSGPVVQVLVNGEARGCDSRDLGTCAGGHPNVRTGRPSFDAASGRRIVPGSPGWNEGVAPGAVPVLAGAVERAEAFDHDGVERPQDGRHDIGAYEGCSGSCEPEPDRPLDPPADPDPPPQPVPACRDPRPADGACASARRSALLVNDRPDDRRDRLIWKWTAPAQPDEPAFGDPTGTTDFAFCLYAGTSAALATEIAVPAGSHGWRDLGGRGYRFRGSARTEGGVRTLLLKEGGRRMTIVFKAKGKRLRLPDLPLAPPALVRLVAVETDACWESILGSGDASENRAGAYRARR